VREREQEGAAANLKKKMQAATPPPDHVARINISLDDIILAPLISLTKQQQIRQMSKPFECHIMHWILTVEKEAPSDGGNGV